MANPNPNPATRFKPGQSGNPGGRRADPLTQAVKAAMTDEDAAAVAATVIALAKDGNLQAVALLWDRLEGKAVARAEHGEPGEFTLTLDHARKVLELGSYRDPSRTTDAG